MMILQRDVDMKPRFLFAWLRVSGPVALGFALAATFGALSVAQAGDSGSSQQKAPAKSGVKTAAKSSAKPKPVVKAAAKPAVKTTTKSSTKPVAKPAVKPTTPTTPVVEAAQPNSSFVSKVTVGEGGTQVREEKLSKTMISFKMVKLPGGTITMPDGTGSKEVTIKPFWIGQKEVSWDEYDAYMFKLDMTDSEAAKIDVKLRPSLPYGAPDRGYGHEGFAAISIHHNGAEQYCKWLTNKTGKKYRLPTEAEWEFAALAGGEASMSADDLKKAAWVQENSDETTHSIGEKAANAWGLHDIFGNAGEWAQGYDGDWVLKGGSFKEPAAKVNAMWRAKQTTAWHDPNKPKSVWWLADGPFAGFRVVCEG